MTLQFVVNILLARMLLPSDFGAIGMLAIFMAVSQSLVDGGFASALIQKKDASQTDFSTVFYWNCIFSALLYGILFSVAPAVARFFHMPVLCAVLRVIGLNVIITGVLSVQITRLRKQLAFRTIACTNIAAQGVGAAVAVVMANHGCGVWSLVAMQLCTSGVAILLLLLLTRWLPSLTFSISALRRMFGFGGYILAAGLLQEFCKNFQGLIIGRRFSATQMGYFTQAYKLDQVSSYSLPQIIVQVMYPVYSSIQDERERLIQMLLMNIRVVSFAVFPVMCMLIVGAEQLIELLYESKWLPCVPYFRIFCVGGFFVCLQNVNFYAVAAVGKSRTLFMWSFYKWGFLLAALLGGAAVGMYGILWGIVLSSINIYLVNAALVARHVGLTLGRQLQSLGGTAGICVIALAATYGVTRLHAVPPLAASGIFAAIYAALAWLFHLKGAREAIDTARLIISKKGIKK